MNILKCFTAVGMAVGAVAVSHGVPAKPGIVDRYMPDGTVVPVRVVGDEFARAILSEDGWPLIESEGTLYFAEKGADGLLKPSQHAVVRRDAATDRWLSGLDREAMLASMTTQVRSMRRSSPMKKNPGLSESSFPPKGEPHAIVILVEYQDVKCTMKDPADYFSRMLNEEGFRSYGGTGSVRDYFVQNSAGQFRPVFDLYGPVQLPEKRAYYGRNVNDFDVHPEEMVIHACQLIDDVVDFRQYDHDGDGMIDNVFVFFAGRGENAGGGDDSVWPHSWDVRGAYPDKEFKFDGVRLGHYACSNEWIGKRPDGIGTFVHEFSHVLGLPDLYETGEVLSGAYTPGAYSVLDTGPYNNNSCTPAGYSMFERYALGWVQPRELIQADDIELENLQDSNDGCIIRVPSNPNEYFLFENRQKKGWDRWLPGHGMLVWHVDFVQSVWDENTVNNDAVHQYVDLEEADGIPSWYNRDGDCFPGTKGVTSFTDSTLPSMKTWAGDVLDMPVTEIAESKNGLISFKVKGGLPASEVPEALPASEVGSYSFKARWNPVPEADKYEISVIADGDEDPVFVGRTDSDATEILVNNIAPETKYLYTVRAWQQGKGASPVSKAMEVTTGETTFEWYAPETVAAPAVNDKDFTAAWIPLENATEYFVTLFQKTDMEMESDTQDFSGGVAALGADWHSSSEFVFDTDAYSGEARPSLRLNAAGGELESPVYPADIHSLVFWHRGMNNAGGNTITIHAFADGVWKEFTDVEVTEEEGGRVDTITGFPYGTRAVKISYEGVGSKRGPIGLDDVTVNLELSYKKAIVNGIDRKSSGTSVTMKIDGLEPETEYFYTVVATDGQLMSKESKPMRVKTCRLGESGIDNVIPDFSGVVGPVEYYNLQGLRIANPSAGQLVIVRQGGKTSKMIFRD